jgi:protein-tyrosine kinase
MTRTGVGERRQDYGGKSISRSGFGSLMLAPRSRRPVRAERDFVAALGEPLLAARPLRAQTLRPLCELLLAHWYGAGRKLLPLVSAEAGEGCSGLATRLAQALAALGVRTLLVDGDLRSPRQHLAFGLKNRGGLADFLAGRSVQFVACRENLAVLVAGGNGAQPLELLAEPRLGRLLEAAARRFGAILIDTPAAAKGPDLQIFAALAGGALVVARRGVANARALARLRRTLAPARARVVGLLLSG